MLLMVILPIGGISVTVDDLKHIIREHGEHDNFIIDGCKVLEYIENIPGFISLLHRFRRYSGLSFVDHYPDPIKAILTRNIGFHFRDGDSNFCGLGIWVMRGGDAWYYEFS
jgi:hypothetical protein